MIDPNQKASTTTNDTTLDDEYEIARLEALPPDLRDLAALHALDQFEAAPSYLERFTNCPEGQTYG